MKLHPLILVSAAFHNRGAEFYDRSVSVSNCYSDALLAVGGLPVVLPAVRDQEALAQIVERCDGVMLTGGEDVEPQLYGKRLPRALAARLGPVDAERDWIELALVGEVFRQHKPLLAICRGHQLLNVALGGTLPADIGRQHRGAIEHNCTKHKDRPVHEVGLTPDSMLARVWGDDVMEVNSSHHQAVDRVAQPLRATAVSQDGIVEAMELKDPSVLPFLLSVQFHPERLFQREYRYLSLFNVFVESCRRMQKL